MISGKYWFRAPPYFAVNIELRVVYCSAIGHRLYGKPLSLGVVGISRYAKDIFSESLWLPIIDVARSTKDSNLSDSMKEDVEAQNKSTR
jgi:hypothetical protein